MRSSIRFGIHSLDSLFAEGDGILVGDGGTKPINMCIVGADGTGKSALALHLASHYCQDQWEATNGPLIFYVSTDLTVERAQRIWEKFLLNHPARRRDHPFSCPLSWPPIDTQSDTNLLLVAYTPLEDPFPEKAAKQVYFVDLASTTGGDDWSLLNRLVATLAPRTNAPPHLVIVDAVEGLETLVGDKDSFGEDRPRRARIAQLLRTAQNKCHVALVIEESDERKRLPEEFVTDVVIRLRYREERDYVRRTLEVEKVRGQYHARGQHDFAIRPDPLNQFSPDLPKVGHDYFYVFPSLHWLDAEGRKTPIIDPVHDVERAGFGIAYLDNMLGETALSGLPVDAPTGLIGEDGTFKSHLGRAFLSQCFKESDDTKWGVAVLLTTRDVTRAKLEELLPLHVGAPRSGIAKRILCRQLEIHHLSPSVLIHIIQRLIEQAQTILGWQEDSTTRRASGHRIRFVVDNWTSIQNAYPEIKHDPIFLPFLIRYLRQQGISTLILATAAGGAKRAHDPGLAVELRDLTPHHLYTWHVPFFGVSRVAITAVPSLSRRLAPIRELRLQRGDPQKNEKTPEEALEVDPHFELYTGLEKGQPRFVPLRVHLYAETRAFDPYFKEMNNVLSRLIYGLPQHRIVITENPESYERLREFSRLQRGARLDHTLVLQVDEFWAETQAPSDPPPTLLGQNAYLEKVTMQGNKVVDPEDPFRLFQPSLQGPKAADGGELVRKQFFQIPGNNYNKYGKQPIQKVPLFWDFGFLMARQSVWKEALEKPLKSGRTVRAVWQDLSEDSARIVSWNDFFEACTIVAETASAKTPSGKASAPVKFDVSMITPETFSCLVLEIWASLIFEAGDQMFGVGRREWASGMSERSNTTMQSLLEWLELYNTQLRSALDLLMGVLETKEFEHKDLNFRVRPAVRDAVASRHWYSTATAPPNVGPGGAGATENAETTEVYVPLALPGRFCVRGDWFLAVARGSRSPRLGERTMDILCSRRANIVRLQLGLGLPVRDADPTDSDEHRELWTPLVRLRDAAGPERMLFKDLQKIGAAPGQRFWLWRSLIKNYDLHARVWQRWLCGVLHDPGELAKKVHELKNTLKRATIQQIV
jgi:KaiC/GvpD/RAD55 family RecA-like ATPase